jgi:hypothetical protein
MRIDDRDAFRRAFAPDEADSPLIVDPDAMSTLPAAAQSLKPVSWNCRHVLQPLGVLQHPKLPPCYRSNVAESAALLAAKEFLGLLAAERSYQVVNTVLKMAQKRDRVGQFLAHLEHQAAFAKAKIARLQERKAFFERATEKMEGYVIHVIESIGPDATRSSAGHTPGGLWKRQGD